MAATVVPSANTTLEFLNLYNYEDWSIRVKTYLIAEGLWDDVVESTAETPMESHFAHFSKATAETEIWRMKNAKALHAIQNYCRTDVFGFIRNISTAKDAWETLAKRLKPKNTDIEGMAATLVPSVMINLKALSQDNYKHWSFWVKRYLLAEDLWDIVKGTKKPPKLEDGEGEAEFMAWWKNNARALHVITIFCGEDDKSSISYIERAKDAWNTLERKFEPPAESLETPEENFEVEVDWNDDADSNDGNADLKIEAVAASDYETYKPFFRNVWDRNWEDVKEFIKQHPEAVRAKGRRRDWSGTAFHSAVFYVDVAGVKELLPFMKKKDLEILDSHGHTALSLAIQRTDTDDATEIVKCIVEKNKKLLLRVVHPSANTIPLLNALSLDKPKKACYLYSVTPLKKLKSRDAAELISTGLRVKCLDIPLDLLRRFPNLAIAKDHSGESPLNELASTRAGLFFDASQLGIWKLLIYLWIPIATHTVKLTSDGDLWVETRPTATSTGDVSIDVQNEEKDQGKHLIRKVKCFFGRLVANLRYLSGIGGIYQMKLLHVQTIEILKRMSAVLKEDNLNYMQHKFVKKAIFQAVERGHVQFIGQIMEDNMDNPSWFFATTNEHDKTVFQFVAEHRQDRIFMIYQRLFRNKIKEGVGRKDKFGNNMLHVVGKLSSSTNIAKIRGAALQMQYELRWFETVESMASTKDLNCINSDGRTPREEFTMNHRDLVEAGEKSMKETASSSSFVGALIITIMFAAVVTVPGGIKGDTGIPIYSDTKAFQTFIVANVISLCCSTTSVLASFGILTSRFAEEDFLISLPTKLIIGLFTLFLSIAGMMIAFSSAIFIMLPEKLAIVIPSIVLACVPIASFLWMENKLLIEFVNSTYGLSVHLIYWWARRIYRRFRRWARRIYWRLWRI